MKKKMFLIAIISIGLMACGGSANKTAESQDVAVGDTLVEEAVEVEETSVEETVSPDYVMLNLKGKVKSYEIKGFVRTIIGNKVEFNEAGQIIKIDGKKPNLERNDKGQITKYSFQEELEENYFEDASLSYFYDKDGQLIKIVNCNAYGSWDTTFKRDENGNIITWTNKDHVEGTISFKLQYKNFDENGNWTKLTEDGEVSTRKLTYWE